MKFLAKHVLIFNFGYIKNYRSQLFFVSQALQKLTISKASVNLLIQLHKKTPLAMFFAFYWIFRI